MKLSENYISEGKSPAERKYDIVKYDKLHGDNEAIFTNKDNEYWTASKKWYDENRDKIKASSKIIYVDFKARKIIKGCDKILKDIINNKAM